MLRSPHWIVFVASAALVTACGDDSGGGDTDSGSSSSSSGSSTDPTTDPTTGSTTAQPTTGTTGTTNADGSSSGSDTDTAESSSSGGDDTGTSGGQLDCDAIPAGPFEPNVQFMPFAGSEDLGFDGQGGLAGRTATSILIVDSDGNEVVSHNHLPGTTYGLRFTADGNLLAARPGEGQILQIAPDGMSSIFASGIGGVNGLYPDLDGNVWATDFSSVVRYDASAMATTIVSGADGNGANGIVYDPDRSVAFFTNYGQGRIAKVDINADGSPGDVTALATIGGALLDGLSLDACGNVYAVDNGGTARVFRLMLDENADAVGDATNIVDGTMENVANAQFGRGEGFDETSLYVTGGPGTVYRLDVGVPGAEIPLP